MNTNLTLLLVTKNSVFQDALRQTVELLQANWNLEMFQNLETLLERCYQFHASGPEADALMILLDPQIQAQSGLLSLMHLLHEVPHIPIVQILHPEAEDMGLEGIKFGAQDYLLITSLTPIKLHRTIRNAIRRHDVMQRLRDRRQLKTQDKCSPPIV
jgi:DNA-binding NarL/FixJ family response regulator